MSVPAPNYTQTPNIVFEALPLMGEAEMRVTLTICRETFGWHQRAARLSISDLERLTGLSRQGVVSGVAAGMERGLIGRAAEGNGFAYFINIEANETSESARPSQPNRLVNEVDQSSNLTSASQPNRPEIVNEVDQHIKGVKEKRKLKKPSPSAGANEATPVAGGDDGFSDLADWLKREHGIVTAERFRAYPDAATRAYVQKLAAGGANAPMIAADLAKPSTRRILESPLPTPAPPPPPAADDVRRPAWIAVAQWQALTDPQRDALALAQLVDGRIEAQYPEWTAMIYRRWTPTMERLIAATGAAQ